MQDELARVAVGLPVACLWPLTVPYLASSRLRVSLTAAASALYILAPQIPSASSLLLLGGAIAIPITFRPSSDAGKLAKTPHGSELVTYGPILAAFLLGLIAAALIDFEAATDALERVVDSDRVAFAATGLITAVFIGGEIVARILQPFTRTLSTAPELQGLADSGRYIGWFERAVLFGFVIGGQPEAAAIAFAAKSFAARFPTVNNHHGGLPEYFLIGSLASLTIAVAAAAGTRAALGIGPF